MKRYLRSRCAVLAVAVVVSTCSCRRTPTAAPPLNPGAAEAVIITANPVEDAVNDFRRSTRLLYNNSRFDELEKLANGIRSSKERFANGSWKIVQFYSSLACSSNETEAMWQLHERIHKAWEAAKPDSITARVAHADFLTAYAWHARGSGFADTVTAEGGQLFEERLTEARKVLEEAKELPEKCPYWWLTAMTVALGQGWSRPEFDQLFEEAKKFEPTFWGYDAKRGVFLLPRWYGEPGDWEKAAEAEIKRPGGIGAQSYARVVIGLVSYYTNIFNETKASWPLTQQGMVELRKSYPEALEIVSNYARLACLAGDRPTAKRLFDELNGRFITQSWTKPEEFVGFRKWASGDLEALPLTVRHR